MHNGYFAGEAHASRQAARRPTSATSASDRQVRGGRHEGDLPRGCDKGEPDKRPIRTGVGGSKVELSLRGGAAVWFVEVVSIGGSEANSAGGGAALSGPRRTPGGILLGALDVILSAPPLGNSRTAETRKTQLALIRLAAL